jgi:predicted nuclease with TOPRIM domain
VIADDEAWGDERMSNNEHDPHEPTGARLTEAQVAKIAQTAEHYQQFVAIDGVIRLRDAVRALLADRAALVADAHGWRQVAEEERRTREIAQERYGNVLGEKSALVNDVARLQARLASWRNEITRLTDELADEMRRGAELEGYIRVEERRAEAAENQVAAMRAIVEAVANGGNADDFSQRAGYRLNHHIYASDEMREQVRALVATWQTPAAPTPDGHTAPNGENDRG